jgi:hypothetical protein
MDAAKHHERAVKISKEIRENELQFVNDLEKLIGAYLEPLQCERILSQKEIASLFSNIRAIHYFNSSLLGELSEVPLEDFSQIGALFRQRSPFFSLYVEYIRNYSDSLTTLLRCYQMKPEFREFLKRGLESKDRALELSDLLYAPVQRAQTYELFLKDLMSHSPENRDLRIAAKFLEEMNYSLSPKTQIIDRMRRLFQTQHLFPNMQETLVEPHRVFHSEGDFFRDLDTGQKKKIKLFLFNDILILAPYSVHSLDGDFQPQFLKYDIVPLKCCTVMAEGSNTVFDLTAEQKGEVSQYRLTAPDVENRNFWLESLQDLISIAKEDGHNPSPLVNTDMPTKEEKKSPIFGIAKWSLIAFACLIFYMMLEDTLLVLYGIKLAISMPGPRSGLYGIAAILFSVVGITFLIQAMYRPRPTEVNTPQSGSSIPIQAE